MGSEEGEGDEQRLLTKFYDPWHVAVVLAMVCECEDVITGVIVKDPYVILYNCPRIVKKGVVRPARTSFLGPQEPAPLYRMKNYTMYIAKLATTHSQSMLLCIICIAL